MRGIQIDNRNDLVVDDIALKILKSHLLYLTKEMTSLAPIPLEVAITEDDIVATMLLSHILELQTAIKRKKNDKLILFCIFKYVLIDLISSYPLYCFKLF